MRVISILSIALLASCAGEEADDDGVVGVGGKDDGVTEFKLTLTTSSTTGAVRAKETPKLAGAPTGTTSFSCAVDDKTDQGWRLLCSRGKERLSLAYGPDEKLGAIVYAKSTTTPDYRSYYRCTAATQPSGKWPGTLECKSKQPLLNISGQMVSPFASSIDDVGIFNAHVVAETPTAKVLRGMKPFRPADYENLSDQGVGAVLMFKKPTSASEVTTERTALDGIGVPSSRFVNIEFLWKDFPDFGEPCRQTVQGLKLLTDWAAAGHTAFLHCTVGEDRTGYLAGLYRMLTEGGEARMFFDDEMCERGYSAGNPQKPGAVTSAIDDDLTPLFVKMAFKIANGELTSTSLDESVCDVDPETDPGFTGAEWDAAGYRCVMSARYRL